MRLPLIPNTSSLLFIACLFLLFALSPNAFSQTFEKNYGTSSNESFTKVIKDGSDYYVLGSNEPSPGILPRATVSRVDALGVWQWTLSLDISSVWSDAVLTSNGDLLLVGYTLPFNADNQSLLARIVNTPTGGFFSCLNRYNVEGREGFYRIVENPVPEHPAYPYYILGGQYQPGSGAITDDVILLNIDENCVFNWKKSISTANDDEWLRALEALPNGDLLLGGNDETLGLIFKTDNSGIAITGFQIPQQVFRDISLNAAGDFLAAATAFNGNEAFIYKFDQDLVYQWNAKIPQLVSISQIWEASPGILYVVGRGPFDGAFRDVIIKIDNTDPLLVPSIIWTKYYSAGSNFTGGSAWYLPPGELAYTDTRILPNGFGGNCAFMAVNNLELDNCLVTATAAQLNFLSPLPDGPPLPPTTLLANPMGVMLGGIDLIYEEQRVCSLPCEVAIVVNPINPCGFVQVCAVATGSAPYDYQWCDGQNTSCFNTQLSWGDNTFCVSITCADGMVASATLTYNFAETVPPTITCPPNLLLHCASDLSPATTGTATATDNCDPSPSITYSDMIFGVFPCDGLLQRTWTAEDDCGNTASCIQNINVLDNIAPVITNCTQNITLTGTFNANGVCEAFVQIATPVVTDNCDLSPTITNNFNNSNNASGLYPQGSTTVVWTATDNCGNTSTCTFIVTVNCAEDCTCGDYTQLFYRPSQGAPNIAIMCNDTLLAQCDGPIPWTLGGDFLCAGNSCPPTTQMAWLLTSPSFVQSNGTMMATSGFNISIPPTAFNESGDFQLQLSAICGADTCYCNFTVQVACDTCCTDFEAFCDQLDQEVIITTDEALCKATLNVGDIGPCNSYLEYVSWGDGTTDTGPYSSGAMPMHTYPSSGSYEICYLAIELDDDGFICFEKIVCETIALNCLCCRDATVFFAAAPNIPLNGNLGDCFINFNATDLDDCWQISYQWGDLPVFWDGPYPNNTSVTHTYQNDGVYNVCYLLEEVDADGEVCWEYTQCMDIELICPDTCALPPYEDMVAWWPMEEQDSDPVVVDIIGVNNGKPMPGSAVGNPNGPSTVPGKVGNALHFISPGNTHINVPDDPSLHFGNGSFSIDAWIKTSPGTQTEPIVDKLGVTNDGYALSVQGTVPHFLTLVLGTGSGVNVLTGPAINPGEWNFVAVTVAPPSVTFYVKNSLGQAQTTVAIPGGIVSATNNRPLLIGASVQNLHWNIMIDELEIFNRELTPTEINEICNADSLGKCPPSNLGCLCNALQNDVNDGYTETILGLGIMGFQPNGPLGECDEVTWTWGDGSPNGFSTGMQAIEHDYTNSGIFNVCMSVTRTESADFSCTRSICRGVVDVNERPEASVVHLFPNPSSGQLTLEFEQGTPKDGRLQIIDLLGRVVQAEPLPRGTTRHPFSVAKLPAGVYLVKVQVDGFVLYTGKMVKE